LYAAVADLITLPDRRPPRRREGRAARPRFEDTPRRPHDSTRLGRRYPRRPSLEAFDLNAADTALLKRVRGIGAKRAAVLVDYREKLGGYVSYAQMADVWILDDSSRAELLRYARIDTAFRPRPLRINEVTAEELGAHPYVNRGLARVIVRYREQHGPYRTADDLRNIRILEPERLEKLRPYLAFE
ncbi:MAG: helix-hairpin-helix domain-containing protein, partial [Catalinimonas sp.]